MDETVSLSGRELTALDISTQGVAKGLHDLRAIREDYILRFVASAYYNVLLARKNLEIADANLERLTKYRDAAEKRLRIGEVTRTVLLRAEGELSGARSDQLQAKNGLELAMAVLASNVGIKGPLSLSGGSPGGGGYPPDGLFSDPGLCGTGRSQEHGGPEADRRGSDTLRRRGVLALRFPFPGSMPERSSIRPRGAW